MKFFVSFTNFVSWFFNLFNSMRLMLNFYWYLMNIYFCSVRYSLLLLFFVAMKYFIGMSKEYQLFKCEYKGWVFFSLLKTNRANECFDFFDLEWYEWNQKMSMKIYSFLMSNKTQPFLLASWLKKWKLLWLARWTNQQCIQNNTVRPHSIDIQCWHGVQLM